jgi:hypothetical protein
VTYNIYNLYFPCGTTTPANQQVLDLGTYTTGDIVKLSNGLCYTVANTGTTIQQPAHTVVSEHSSCEDCASGPTLTPTPTATTAPPTATPTPSPIIYYYTLRICNSLEEIIGRSLTFVSDGTVVKIAGTCYTVINSTTSPNPNDIDLSDVYESCSICDPSPTMTPTPTPTLPPTYYFFNAIRCSDGANITVKSLINHSSGTVGAFEGECYTIDSVTSGPSSIDVTETVVDCFALACGYVPPTATPTSVPPTATPTPSPTPVETTFYNVSGCTFGTGVLQYNGPDNLSAGVVVVSDNGNCYTIISVTTGPATSGIYSYEVSDCEDPAC